MEILDWTGAILILISIYLIGKKIAIGWILNTLGAICFGILALYNELYGWFIMEVIICYINGYNFIKWTKK